uniref:Uncharacterized protein n=1 Tax=Trichogramma kaykai TaxID=54128 RepID=A0ABD2WI94_9HYME
MSITCILAGTCVVRMFFAVVRCVNLRARTCPRIHTFIVAGPYFPSLCLGSLLVALFAVTVGQGAPLAMMSQEAREARRLVSVAKWKNPCGFAAEELADDDVEVVQLDDATLLGNIVMQAKTALNYAQNVRDDYIKRTFGTDFKDLHLTWKDNHYDWLPGLAQIPKQLGEPLGLDYLDKLDVRMVARQCTAQRVRVPAALRGRPGAGRLGPAGQRARLPAGVQGHGESSAIGLVRGTDGPGRAQRASARGHRSRHHARGVSQHVDQRDLSQSARLAHLSRLHERPRVHRRGVRSSDLADPEDVRLSCVTHPRTRLSAPLIR